MDIKGGQEGLRRSPTMVDVLDRVLHKGIVIDAQVSVAVVGLEVATVEVHVVVASIDRYLGYTGSLDRAVSRDRTEVDFEGDERFPRTPDGWNFTAPPQETGGAGFPAPRNRITEHLAGDPWSGDHERPEGIEGSGGEEGEG